MKTINSAFIGLKNCFILICAKFCCLDCFLELSKMWEQNQNQDVLDTQNILSKFSIKMRFRFLKLF